jgi:hypothetical protein
MKNSSNGQNVKICKSIRKGGVLETIERFSEDDVTSKTT